MVRMSKPDLKAELYEGKGEVYDSGVLGIKWPVIDLIPAGDHKILDVGCGAGDTLMKLKELGKAGETVGIEINKQVTQNLSDALDKLYVGDVETIDLPYTEKYFDYILFADVLEHLINPRKVLHDYKSLLRDDGCIIATIPNIKHYSVLIKLVLLDEFRYGDSGILDWTHLRFFTKKEIIKMFQDEGFEVVDLIHLPVSRKQAARNVRNVLLGFSNRLLGKNSFHASGYLIRAKKQKLQDDTATLVLDH
jgi:2-polyprenyl-3-methyl-5-hydroxy-6-metoxy-1,4-benzoquinol methylase